TCDPPDGSTFPVGTTTVTCQATDGTNVVAQCTFSVTVTDCEAPQAACRPAPNPGDKKIPVAGKNPSSGQNPDGYYQLLSRDNCDGSPKMYVQDTASTFLAGPFNNGDIVKLSQNKGGTPHSDPGTPPVVAHIHLNGDAWVYAADADGNISDRVLAKVPPPDK